MKLSLLSAFAVAATLVAAPAAAVSVLVTNASFETPPSGAFLDCGSGCLYTADNLVPGWTVTGPAGQSGLFRPALPLRFNSIPDGITVAYSNVGTISQTVGVLAQAGFTYTLKAWVGLRNDGFANAGTARLVVGSNTVTATGVAPAVGHFSEMTATYIATLADAGSPITIELFSAGDQGTFDLVSLTAVPEPEMWAMMIVGFGLVGAARRRQRTAVAA
ncbi:PEPxxWA-CTERM sorting domain-containing protein [Sandarakinorhabdus sp.]|uniref:PEPxxWA-CTERM sorting domain-containing protein n=1 Tax=Sandarakinorhabdus sp. TaxID=1916663 RepID=UPI003341E46D